MLIPLAVVLTGLAVWFFLWSVRSGQYDDLEGPAHRILMDDDDPMIPGNEAKKNGAAQDTQENAQERSADKQD